MSLTGMGFDSSTRGGSFFGKKKSSRLRNRDFHSGSSKPPPGRRRFRPPSSPELFAMLDIGSPAYAHRAKPEETFACSTQWMSNCGAKLLTAEEPHGLQSFREP